MVFLFLLLPFSLALTVKEDIWKRTHRNLRVTEIPTWHRGRSKSDLISLSPIVSPLASPTKAVVVEARGAKRDLLQTNLNKPKRNPF
jgi:hypothetical protein